MITKLITYKGVDIFYDHERGDIKFDFEGERSVKYVFEAERIIDEPVWEECKLEGYFIDGTFNDFIGKAISEKKDIKSKKPYWKFKGKYDLEYKNPRDWSESGKVFLRSEHNDKVYAEFVEQAEVVKKEEILLKNIISKLSN